MVKHVVEDEYGVVW